MVNMGLPWYISSLFYISWQMLVTEKMPQTFCRQQFSVEMYLLIKREQVWNSVGGDFARRALTD